MNIIFHHPLPLDLQAKSASGIRPLKMLEAFKALGCKVDIVCGYSSERKQAIEVVKGKIRKGVKYNLVYAESSTQPTTLTDTHHLPLRPWMDYCFFRFCRKNDIPIGLFYRDIYWAFEGYGKDLHPLKVLGAKLAYRFDLWAYKKTLNKLYLPSLEMGKYVPMVNSAIFAALPPGHNQSLPFESAPWAVDTEVLRIFYVGGMSNHYQMHSLFEAVNALPLVELTICTRESEWKMVKNEYPTIGSNIKIIHENGVAMEEKLRACDLASIFVKPQEYREFASPVKLYEYLGFQKPILASHGTLAGNFVEDNGIGWAVDYNTETLKLFLLRLLHDKSRLLAVRQAMPAVAEQHSWQARARQVIQDLSHT